MEILTTAKTSEEVSNGTLVKNALTSKRGRGSLSQPSDKSKGNVSKKQKSDTKINVRQTEAKLEFKSPAEFFANNKNIAGFDNVS
jgi:hypothetical protein